jgi:thiol-disulfide isomerase/thioredoxin
MMLVRRPTSAKEIDIKHYSIKYNMKKVIFLLVGMIAAMTSCNSEGSGSKYVIDGTIKDGGNKIIYLEKLNMSKVTVIDTAQVDGSGNFHLSSAAEKGFYRLRIDNNHMWLMLLENKKYKAELDFDKPMDYKITGTALNDEFENGVKYVTDNQIKQQTLKMTIQQQQNQGVAMDIMQKEATEIDQLQQALEVEMKKRGAEAKDPLVALYFTSFLRMDKYPDENKKIVERMQKEIPTSSYTQEMVTQYSTLMQQMKAQEMAKKSESATAIGAMAPDLAFTNPDGKTLKLSELRGKVVLLDFWASWCRPCRMENPNVVAAYKKFKDKGFTIYSVSLDQNGEAWKQAIQQDGLIWPNHVSDLKGWQSEPAHIYGVQGIPAQFLLDKDGKIIAKNLRGEQLEQKLSELLK